jgi:hypothetical protein
MSASNKCESVRFASVIGGISLAFLHTAAMSAEPATQAAERSAEANAPVFSQPLPLLGRAHRHGDGHRCDVPHGPVAMPNVVSRPLQMVQQLPSENQKAARLRSAP